MCLAIANPKGRIIPEEHLINGFEANSDGAGFSIVNEGKIEIHKGFFTLRAFLEAYEAYKEKPSIIHFRWATHGDRTSFNCHPWEVVKDSISMVHNGVLSCESTKEMSDTGHFVEYALKPVLTDFPDLIYNPAYLSTISMAIGSFNKFAFLDRNELITIVNEDKGEWCNEVWYSNGGYKETRKTWTYGKGYHKKGFYYSGTEDPDYMNESDWWHRCQKPAIENKTAVTEAEQIAEKIDETLKGMSEEGKKQQLQTEVSYWMKQGKSKKEAKRLVYGKHQQK